MRGLRLWAVGGAAMLVLGGCTGIASLGDEEGGKTEFPSGGSVSAVDDGAPLGALDPGLAPIRRLTKHQVELTVKALIPASLMKTPVDFATLLSDDATSDDYNNQAVSQTANLTLIEHYRDLAQAISRSLQGNTDEQLAALWTCAPKGANDRDCMSRFVNTFARRAYRRPLSGPEQEALVNLGLAAAAQGSSFAVGGRTVVEAVLQSTSFLYRAEQGGEDGERPELVKLDGPSVASRLSFLILNRAPDDALLDAAERGELDTRAGVMAQADRLLALPEAKFAVRDFYEQWLRLEKVPSLTKSATLFPSFTPAVAASMLEETRRLLDTHVWENRDFLGVLDADKTYVDGALANIYGVETSSPNAFVEVTLPAERRGIFGHASVLAGNAHQENSSPTLRGLLIRRRLFCQELAPPPGVDTTPAAPAAGEGPKTQREIAEEHSNNPACSGCHALFDGIGFGLESFDAVGAVRELDAGKPVFDDGVLVADGKSTPFKGVSALATLLRGSAEVRRCVVRNWIQWASGRSLEGADNTTVSFVERDFRSNDQQFLSLVRAYVGSDAFRFSRP